MNRLIKSTALGLSVLMGCSLCACGVTDSSLGQKTEINPGLWVEKEVALEPDPSDILALTTTTDGQLLCATVQSNGEASQKVDVLSSSDGYTWDTTPVYSVEVPGTCIEASLTESGVLVLIRTEDEEQIWYGAKETECSQVQPADSEVTDINNIQFVNSDSFLMAGRDTNNQSVAAIFSLRDGRMVTKVGAGTEWGGFAQHGDELAFISETGKLSTLKANGEIQEGIVVFFAVMLILTLVARGTSSAIRPVVTTQQAKAGTISQSVQSSGSITASSVLSVSLPEGIVLDNILVKEGQSVVEGQTLATCDVDELSTKLDRAKASLQKSKAEYNQLLSNAVLDDTSVARTQQALLRAYEADQKAYEELEKLRASENPDPEAISTAEQAADDAHWAAQQAEYDRNSALASYQEMQRQNNLSAQVNQASAEDVALDIKDTQAEIEQLEQLVNQQGVISSPFSGVISNVEAEVGTESTQTFCTIYDTSKGYLFACELPAAQASDCQTGLSAVIKQGDQTETAAITAISENAENDTVDITIQLTATDWKVGPADAEIVLSEQDYDLCLPNTAIHQDNQGDFVFAVEEKNTVLGTQNVLVRIPVTVLEVGQSQTSIEGAILPEDSIVVQSTRSLEAGSKVRVKNENA